MSDVTPLKGRDKLRERPRTLRRRRREDPIEGIRFEVERDGDRIEGWAEGIDRRHVRKLRGGEVPRDARLDLHGLRADAAHRRVRETLERVQGEGGRCVLVIHGRGRHSEAEPVLKDALVDWLTEAPLDTLVMAFTSARQGDGGVGATYVLLRRAK